MLCDSLLSGEFSFFSFSSFISPVSIFDSILCLFLFGRGEASLDLHFAVDLRRGKARKCLRRAGPLPGS